MISIVCPFYNERENIPELFKRLLESAEKLPGAWEVIFVNDGSTDGGAEELKKLAEGKSQIRRVELARNYGLTTALYAGLQEAKGDILATLDADLQNPPEELPRLFGLMDGFDMVTGIRANRRDTPVKKVSSKIANAIRRAFLQDKIVDVGCSLRIFRRSMMENFYPYKGMHRFFPAIAELRGFKIRQVPVEHHDRKRGKAKYGLFNRILGPLWDLLSVRWLLTRKIEYQIKGVS